MGSDGVNQALQIGETYIAPFAELMKYAFVFLLLFIIYKKIIAPFATKMLEVSQEDEELERPTLDLDEDDLVEKVQQMRKKVEDQLGVGEGFNEDELKYDVLLEKVKTMAEDQPEEVAALLQALMSEEAEATS